MEEYYTLLQQDRLVGLLRLDFTTLILLCLYTLTSFGMYAALRRSDKAYAALAIALIFVGMTFKLAPHSAFSMIRLSDQIAAAAVREEVIAQQVRIDLAQGRLAAAEASLNKLGFSFKDQFTLPNLSPTQKISALRILLYRAQVKDEVAELKPGIELADQIVDSMLQSGYNMIAIETLLLRAQMHAVLGDDHASEADYLAALQIGEPECMISILVEEGPYVAEALAKMLKQDELGDIQPAYVQDILAAFASAQRPVVKDGEGGATQALGVDPEDQIIEPLTNRELEVLGLMAEGLKYGEIAEQLYISLNTVRYHVKAIYGKLNVNNRTKAIEKAHLLGIL